MLHALQVRSLCMTPVSSACTHTRWPGCQTHLDICSGPQLCACMQSVPQWLWSPVLEGMTSAVTRASSLQEAVAKLAELPVAFNSALLPQVKSSAEHSVASLAALSPCSC